VSALAKRRALAQAATPAPGHVGSIAREGGGHAGTMANWFPRRNAHWSASRERALIAARAEDLAANDAHAAGLVDSLAVNVAGTGLRPQSRVNGEALGITEEAAAVLRDSIEAAFASWCAEADAGGRMNFDQLQLLNTRMTMMAGEYVNLCVDMTDVSGDLPPGRHFAMALQSVHPARMRTPAVVECQPNVIDGVELGPFGNPTGYWIAQPDTDGRLEFSGLTNARYYPARIAHRSVVLHAFPQRQAEQVRGVSVLAPAMKFFRDLSDCLDYELVGQLVTSAFPLAIESEANVLLERGMDPSKLPMRPSYDRIASVEGGSVLHLYPGEKAHVLDAPRPGSNFDAFVTRILRAAGAQAGLPYEVVVKDFSKTNYSSARAALLEAWRVFQIYQDWLEFAFCVPTWRMVIEEAFARDMITLPPGAPDFYEAMDAYLAADWIPPRRGHIDPVKEMQADLLGLEAGVTTHAEVIASRGGDWEATFRQLRRELELKKKLGLASPVPAATKADDTSEGDASAVEHEENPEKDARP